MPRRQSTDGKVEGPEPRPAPGACGLSVPSSAKLRFSQGLANFLALLALQILKPLSNGLPSPLE